MTLPTEPIRLSEAEVKLLRPSLSWINENVRQSRWECWVPKGLLYPGFAGDVYENRRYDETFLRRVLQLAEAAQKHSEIPCISVGVFDVACLALALRVTLHERLGADIDLDVAHSLARKLECARKRLKRATQKQHGEEAYRNFAHQWRCFVAWLRYNILCFRRRRVLTGINMLRREQRNETRQIGKEITLETADQKAVRGLIDCARREIRQGRHKGVRLRALLADPVAARKFFAQYIAEYGKPEWLKKEYWPDWYRAVELTDRLKQSMTIEDEESTSNSSPETAQPFSTAGSDNNPIQDVVDSHQESNSPPVASDEGSQPCCSPRCWPNDQLVIAVANWIVDEVEPGYRSTLVEDTQSLLLTFHHVVKEPCGSALEDIIAECQPPTVSDCGPDVQNFYAEWLLRIVTTVNPNIHECLDIIEHSSKLARETWDRLDKLTRNSKIKAIHRRYFNDCLCA